METYSRNEQDKDVWTYSTQSASYKVQTTYKLLMGHQPVQPVLKWLWKSYCQPKHRVFFWLLMKDRLSIKNILKRRNATGFIQLCFLYISPGRNNTSFVLGMPIRTTLLGTIGLQIIEDGDTVQNIQPSRTQLRS
jgi:hypothetical protein